MSPLAPVYVVSSTSGVEQVFAHLTDAEDFAGQNPGVWITQHGVRASMAEAVEVFDRLVVVAGGATVLDRTKVVRQFVDDPLDTPAAADVEWFLDSTDSQWHIIAFGIDKDAVDAQVQRAFDLVSQSDRGAAVEVAGARGPS